MQYVVIVVGKIHFGIQSVHGPFIDFNEAELWAGKNAKDQPNTIIRIRPPE